MDLLCQDDEASRVVLPQEMTVRGAMVAQQSSVRLVELGPRMRYHCFGTGSTWIRIQLVAWIRIRIRNADQDLRGLKRAKMKKKTQLKDR
jgi:hypothetical protein